MQATAQAAARTAIGAGIPFTPASLAQIIGGTDNAAGVTALGLNQAGLTFATNFVGISKGFLLPKNTDANTGIIKQNGLVYWNTYCPALDHIVGGYPKGGNLMIGEGLGNFSYSNLCHANLGIGGPGENGEAAPFKALTDGDENIGIGYGCLSALTTGKLNHIVGNAACTQLTTGNFNVGLGGNVLGGIALDDSANVAIGSGAMSGARGTSNLMFGDSAGPGSLYNNCVAIGAGSVMGGDADSCVCVGAQSLGGMGNGLDGIVAIGNYAGYYATQSNELWIDNRGRDSYAAQQVQSLLYGGFAATPSTQFLTVNGKLTWRPWASVTPANNGELSVEATSNSLITFKLKGTDGTVRAGTLALV